MNLSEYLIEAVASRKTGKYNGRTTETEIRKAILDQLIVNVTGQLDTKSEYTVVTSLSRLTEGDCLWADFFNDKTGETTHFLAGANDNRVGELVFDKYGHPIIGIIYSVNRGRELRFVSSDLDDTIKYFMSWTHDRPW